jgi:3-ketosteroid 9alpha-monooxygenase subunit B
MPETNDTTRKRIKELEVMVADVVEETPDTVTLLLFTGNDRLEYQAGHFLTIDPHQFHALERFIDYFEDVKGKKEPPRAYSMASAPYERWLAFTVKEERYVKGTTKFPPLLSPLLVRHMRKGERIQVTGFTGPYTLPEDLSAKTDHLVHICAGSGIVPNFSMIKQSLLVHPKVRHTLVYSNKTPDDIIFRRQLDSLERAHPGHLRVIHTLTRANGEVTYGPQLRKGRVDAKLLAEVIPDPKACLVYACGPAIGPIDRKLAKEKGVDPSPRFLEAALSALAELAVPKDRVRHESYG